jgi:hypothetical protein
MGECEKFFLPRINVSDTGSGAFLTLDPGSGIGFFIPDLGSQTHVVDRNYLQF